MTLQEFIDQYQAHQAELDARQSADIAAYMAKYNAIKLEVKNHLDALDAQDLLTPDFVTKLMGFASNKFDVSLFSNDMIIDSERVRRITWRLPDGSMVSWNSPSNPV